MLARYFHCCIKRVAIVLLGLTLSSSHAWAGDQSLPAEANELAKMLLVEFTEAVIAGPEKLAPMLAPEYQIMRSNGVGYNREEYLKRGVGTLSIKPVFSHQDLVVTVADKVMVVRYLLEVDETIEGVPISKRAPRLTVFRLIGDRWRVVSHSNFARHDG